MGTKTCQENPSPSADGLIVKERPFSLSGLCGQAVLVVVVGLLILWMLLYPFHFRPWDSSQWLSHNRLAKLNTLSNIILFVPYGLVAAWVGARLFPGAKRVVIVLVLLDAAALSFIAETLQVLEVQRESSAVDIAANALGGLLGAAIGWKWSGLLTDLWDSLELWLAQRPVAKRCLLVLAMVVIVKTAPFDISLETRYLRFSLYDTRAAGLPMSATRAWATDTTANPWLRRAAMEEAARVAVGLITFAVAVITVGQAVQESSRRWGDRVYPLISLLLFGVLLVLATEALQWPIRSRLMDTSDAAGGVAGVFAGGLIGLWWHNTHKQES